VILNDVALNHIPHVDQANRLYSDNPTEYLRELCAQQATRLDFLEQELSKVQESDGRLEQELLEARELCDRERSEYDKKIDQMAKLQARLQAENEELFSELEKAAERIESLKAEVRSLQKVNAAAAPPLSPCLTSPTSPNSNVTAAPCDGPVTFNAAPTMANVPMPARMVSVSPPRIRLCAAGPCSSTTTLQGADRRCWQFSGHSSARTCYQSGTPAQPPYPHSTMIRHASLSPVPAHGVRRMTTPIHINVSGHRQPPENGHLLQRYATCRGELMLHTVRSRCNTPSPRGHRSIDGLRSHSAAASSPVSNGSCSARPMSQRSVAAMERAPIRQDTNRQTEAGAVRRHSMRSSRGY